MFKKIADNHQDDSYATQMRRRRFQHFLGLLNNVPHPLTILDVGGTQGFWERMGFVGEPGVAFTILNLEPQAVRYDHFHSIVGDATDLSLFADASFDVVYGHGVLQYAAAPERIIAEAHRVLKPGGRGIFMVYNRISWLNALSKVMKVALEHEDAPVLKKYSIGEFTALLAPFAETRIVPERFPVKSRLHHGWKAMAFNGLFVGTFNALPRALVRPLGWHLMAFCTKAPVPAARR